jgi:PAS domain-containing protein
MTDGGGLRGGELLFDALLAQSADPALLSRPDGTVLRANAAACAALGRLEAELQALGSNGLAVATHALQSVLALRLMGAKPADEPARLVSTQIDGLGADPLTLTLVRDVSTRLEESEERFRVAF